MNDDIKYLNQVFKEIIIVTETYIDNDKMKAHIVINTHFSSFNIAFIVIYYQYHYIITFINVYCKQ